MVKLFANLKPFTVRMCYDQRNSSLNVLLSVCRMKKFYILILTYTL